ncbi:hypothetical protein [Roseococcus pinisoli]|uniref:YtkA-like domain-containing protein n=1 Tax=Roseococcus pinisoli TaxID=2835040 RepID=A0ABS5QKR6_9PROT|nr:hypothetical protein [Roseococcus pinisoli]MBS7813620.1 hypothetical protein [Roseococcus pinisoli]
MQRRNLLAAATGLATLALPFAGQAQNAAGGHRHVHSGAEVRIGAFEAELVVRGSEATLTIVDANEQPVDAARFRATAVALGRGNERRNMEFRPAGANRLTSAVDFPFDGKFRATVTLHGPDGLIGTGRYNVDASR